jgi:hypothetical protein
MKSFYVIEEDPDSINKAYLGEALFKPEEYRAMVLGKVGFIPDEQLVIPVKYRRNHDMADFLNARFPLVSEALKNLMDENTRFPFFYRQVFLQYQDDYPLYFYIAPLQLDCIDFKNSDLETDEKMPGGLRIKEGGFYLRPERVFYYEIFRVKGLSGRKLIISERLKNICEAGEMKGIRYTETKDYRD